MRITWAPLSQVGARGTTSAALTAQSEIQDVTISNLNLSLAVEKNQVLANQIMNQVMTKGMNILVDCVQGYTKSITGARHTIDHTFSRADGRTLKKVYSIPYLGSSTTQCNYFNHHYDQAAHVITNMYTALNNQRLQQFNMVTADGDEYMVMKDKLKGSVIQTKDQFLSYYFFVDSFDNLRLHDREPNVVNGLSLEKDQKYDVVATAESGTVSREWYIFAVCQRMLMIGPDEIRLD